MKKWIDPKTASKLVILTPDEVLPTLSTLIDIVNIPKEYGGGFEFRHGMMPDLDTGISNQVEWLSEPAGSLPEGPMKWIMDNEGKRTAVAVGQVKGMTRLLPIFKI